MNGEMFVFKITELGGCPIFVVAIDAKEAIPKWEAYLKSQGRVENIFNVGEMVCVSESSPVVV